MLTKKSAIANLDCVRNMYVSRSIMMKNPCDTVVRVRVCWRYMWCVHDQDCRGVCVSSFAFGGRVPCARVGGVCDYVVALPCFFGFLRMLRSKSPALLVASLPLAPLRGISWLCPSVCSMCLRARHVVKKMPTKKQA